MKQFQPLRLAQIKAANYIRVATGHNTRAIINLTCSHNNHVSFARTTKGSIILPYIPYGDKCEVTHC